MYILSREEALNSFVRCVTIFQSCTSEKRQRDKTTALKMKIEMVAGNQPREEVTFVTKHKKGGMFLIRDLRLAAF